MALSIVFRACMILIAALFVTFAALSIALPRWWILRLSYTLNVNGDRYKYSDMVRFGLHEAHAVINDDTTDQSKKQELVYSDMSGYCPPGAPSMVVGSGFEEIDRSRILLYVGLGVTCLVFVAQFLCLGPLHRFVLKRFARCVQYRIGMQALHLLAFALLASGVFLFVHGFSNVCGGDICDIVRRGTVTKIEMDLNNKTAGLCLEDVQSGCEQHTESFTLAMIAFTCCLLLFLANFQVFNLMSSAEEDALVDAENRRRAELEGEETHLAKYQRLQGPPGEGGMKKGDCIIQAAGIKTQRRCQEQDKAKAKRYGTVNSLAAAIYETGSAEDDEHDADAAISVSSGDEEDHVDARRRLSLNDDE